MSNNFEHYHVHTTDFFSSKVKFIHTSTVTRSHSCYRKNYAYASRTSCHTSNRKITNSNLKINNINIERVTQFNFLGVMFNSHMDWSRHINYISMKISRSTGILYRLKDIYPQSVLLTLYNTLILPHFHYCLLLCATCSKKSSENY